MQNKQEFKITAQAIQNIVSYLTSRPFVEVIDLISSQPGGKVSLHGVSQLPAVEEPKDDSGNKDKQRP